MLARQFCIGIGIGIGGSMNRYRKYQRKYFDGNGWETGRAWLVKLRQQLFQEVYFWRLI